MSKTAELYRMKMPGHLCPFGLKSKYLLKKKGYKVKDHLLRSREETDTFKAEHNVETTPQTFIDGERVGGYDKLRSFFGLAPAKAEGTTYEPIKAVFGTTLLMAIVTTFALQPSGGIIKALELFIAFSMCVLGILKLRDLFSFSNQFLGYDLLAQRYVPYAFVYPFVETGAGILMIGSILIWLAAPAAFFIGLVGAISVVKAVYIDKRELKCACVGGNSNVPLGSISLTENVMMVVMAVWMMTKAGYL